MSTERHNLTCAACHLRFDSVTLLSLHREKFCLTSGRRSVTKSPVTTTLAKDADGSKESGATEGKKLGQMTLSEVKEQLHNNVAQLERLRGGPRTNAQRKIRELRELKIRGLQRTQHQNAEEKALLDQLHELQAKHQSDMQVSISQRQAYQAFRTLNKKTLQQIEQEKRQELEGLSMESSLLEQQEKKILEDIEKLQRSLLHSKPAYLQSHNSTVAVAEQIRIQTAEDNSKIQDNVRQARLAQQREKIAQLALKQGQKIAELELHRKQLEQQKASIQDQLPTESWSVAGGASRLQTPFFDKLKHEKIHGETRLKELKQRMHDENEHQRRQLEDTMHGIEIHKPVTPVTMPRLGKSGHLHNARTSPESIDKGFSGGRKEADGDQSLMAVIRDLRKSYLTTGGKDISMLQKIQQLEDRAAYQWPTAQQPQPVQTSPPMNLPYLPIQPIESQQTLHLIQQIQSQNVKLMEEINHKEMKGKKNASALFPSMDGLEIDQQKELLRMKYETELARQKAEMVRIELEMKQDQERLRAAGKAEPIPQHVAVIDRLEPSPYDPRGGFAIFWDFVVGLSKSYSKVNLVTATISKSGRKSQSRGLPLTHCSAPVEPISIPGNIAMMALKQSYPRFSASDDHAVIVELQGATVGGSSMTISSDHKKAIGWTKIGLFDQFNRVLSGRWKLPIRSSPVQENILVNELNVVPQVKCVELFFRIVNERDVDLQSQVRMEPHLHKGLYKYPVPTVIVSMADGDDYDESLHRSVRTPACQSTDSHQIASSSQVHTVSAKPPSEAPGTPEPIDDIISRPGSEGEIAETVGFQVERIRGVWPGIAMLKLRGYLANGKPVVTATGEELVWESTPIKSNFLAGVHEFGHQKVFFEQVVLHKDSIVIVELWIGKRVRKLLNEQINESDKDENKDSSEQLEQVDDYEKDLEEEADSDNPEKVKRRGVKIIYEEQKLVGWSTFRLVKLPEVEPEEEDTKESKLTVNDGFHRLPLFKAETLPSPSEVVLPILGSIDEPYDRFGDATVNLKVYSDVLCRPNSPASEISELQPISPPYEAWIPHQRQTPPSTPFSPGDGFELCIDGARFLPDIVTATRVSGRIFNHKYIKVGGKVDISTDIDLDSNIYNPCYNYCLRICEERLPPTSTILLKIYTRCRRTKELAIVGFCVLNVFVVSGTNQQPATDSSAIPISLNEGKHQIRIKQSLPKLVIGMNASLLDDTPNVPCASLLVRLIHVPSYGHTHSPLTADHEEGQTSSIPDYADGLYDSMTCKPSEGESRLFADMMTRSVLSVRASMSLFGDGIEKRQRDDNGRRQWIAKRLWRLQEDSPVGVDLTYLARYTPRCGIQFSLDSARNLPWSKLTQCIFCFAPPASFYSGLTDDPVSHNKTTDWASPQKCPEWKDGFQYFGRRRVHRYLVVLIHLFAVDVVKRGRMKVADEAWSAVQVFSEGYVYTNRYQLPLFEGKPSKIVFDYLKHYPASTALNDLVGQRKIRLLDGASVFVRIADGRRHEEIPLTHEVNLDYLPDARQSRYTSVHGNQKPLTELIPKDTNQSDYEQKATTQFNELLVLLLNKNKAK